MGTRIEIPGAATGDGYLALPESGRGPGVVVLHAWWGRNTFIVNLCDRLATEKFVALAPDLYDGKITTSIDTAETYVNELDGHRARSTTAAAIDYLASQPSVSSAKVAVMGFSLGASFAVDATTLRPDQVAAAVVFYGTAEAPSEPTGAVLQGHFADTDVFEPTEQVRSFESALRAAGHDPTFHTYPATRHWFMETDRPEFNAEAAAAAWDRATVFLRSTLTAESL